MKRDINLDLIRSAATVFLLCLHFFTGCGWYNLPCVGAPMALLNILRALFINCVPLFLLLSGYLCCEKTLTPRYYLGLVRIYVIYLLACAACLPIKALYLHEPVDLRYIFGSIANHYACDYSWYVSMYTGLFLMIPFLNLAYKGLKTRRQKQVLVGTAVFLGILPSLLNIKLNLYFTWWTNLYPVAYYLLGAYLHEFRPVRRPGRVLLPLLAALIAFGLLNFFYARPAVFQWKDFTWFAGFECLICSTLLFVLLLNLDLSRWPGGLKKGVALLSRLSFSVYLFSCVPDSLFYPLLRARLAPLACFRVFLPWIAATLLVTVALAWLAEKIARPMEEGLCALLTRAWRGIEK